MTTTGSGRTNVLHRRLISLLDAASQIPAPQTLSVLIVIAVGLALRFSHLYFVDLSMPFRFGGLFAEFADSIADSNYWLPSRIDYFTDGGIPFAYPPIPFYFEAVAIHLLGIPKFLSATLIPLFFASLTLPLFYWLTGELKMRPVTRIASLAAFATFPPLLVQQVEAAGTAESFGTLALVLLAVLMIRSLRKDDALSYVLAGAALAIAIGGSPGSAYAAVLMSMIFAAVIFFRHVQSPFEGLSRLGFYAATGLLLSGPYWILVISRHGVGVFIDPFVAEHATLLGSLFTVFLDFVRFEHFQVSGSAFNTGTFPALSDALIIMGAFWAVFNRKIPLFIWYIFMFNIPREGSWLIAIPATLFIGYAVGDIIIPFTRRVYSLKTTGLSEIVSLGIVLSLLITYSIYMPSLTIQALLHNDQPLTRSTVDAMTWARENLPPNARLVVVSRDQVIEWMPTVSERTVLNVPFGAEWKPDGRRLAKLFNQDLGACADITCVGQAIIEHTGYFELFVYMDREKLGGFTERTETGSRIPRFEMRYMNDEAAIFRMSLSQ